MAVSTPRRRPDRPKDRFYYGYVGRHRVRLETNYKSSVEMLRRLAEQDSENQRSDANAGDAAEVPLARHIQAFELHLRAESGTEQRPGDHIEKTIVRFRKVVEFIRADRIEHLDRDGLNRFLMARQSDSPAGRKLSPKTLDHYAEACRRFGHWLVESHRSDLNPFGKLKKRVTRSNRSALQTFTRRPFTLPELERLVEATESRWRRYAESHPNAKEATLEALRRKGQERAMAYLFAAWTAPRHEALRQLRWKDLDLDGQRLRDPETGRPVPSVTMCAAFAKNRTTSHVPIVPFLVEELREWRKTKAAWLGAPVRESDLVFTLPVHLERKLREDAALAGIEARSDTLPPERIDFHGMRTTTATMCVEAGIAPKVAQQILQHKTIEQTLEVYARLRPEFLGRELDKLPTPRLSRRIE